MPDTCAAINCTNRTSSHSNISFFRFPKDPALKQQWIVNLKRKNFQPSQHSRICSEHFEESSFDFRFQMKKKFGVSGSKAKRQLLPHACPTIFNFSTDVPVVRRGVCAKKKSEMPGSHSTRHCYAVGCTNGDYGLVKWRKKRCASHGVKNGETPCDCPPPYKLFSFPTNKMDPEKRERWIQAFWRADPKNLHQLLQPSRGHRVCSAHFVDGKPTRDHPDPELHLIHTGRRGRKRHVSSLHTQGINSVKGSPQTRDDVQESSLLDTQDAKSVKLSPLTQDVKSVKLSPQDVKNVKLLPQDVKSVELSPHTQDVKNVKLSPRTGEVPEIPQTPLPVQVFVNNHFHQATESKTVTVTVIPLP